MSETLAGMKVYVKYENLSTSPAKIMECVSNLPTTTVNQQASESLLRHTDRLVFLCIFYTEIQ